MCTMILNMAAPCSSANYVRIKKPSRLCKASSTTPWTIFSSRTKTRGFKCFNIAKPYTDETLIARRSGNYTPCLWDSNYIQSLSSEYRADKYLKRASELVLQVTIMLEKETEGIRRLELIDNLQKLGISYHFQDKIRQILNSICHDQHDQERDLYSTAMEFRLLRQYGFSVSEEVFDSFKNDKGDFKTSLAEDTKGLIQLYEASFLLTTGEETLELAREYSTKFLQKKLDDRGDDVSLMVSNALELPLHWRNERLNARSFIDVYGCSTNMNPVVLELAKLDFNILQETYQEELKHVLRWWEETGLAKKLPFARDRLVECYAWGLGEISQPEYGYARIINTKVNILITVIDDMFDIFGTVEELKAFNNIIQRWDTEAIEQLPDYMQLCFLALNNFVDEMAYHVLKDQGFLILPYLRKLWAGLCSRYIQEVEWYSTGYTPKLEEYINIAWYTVGTPLMLYHELFAMTNPIEKEVAQSLFKFPNLIQRTGIILRLANDLGTSPDEMERGDVPKSIQCYMNETGVGREEAAEHIRFLIRENWKKMNEEIIVNSSFSQDFIKCVADLSRTGQYMYQYGDGLGVQSSWIEHRLSTLLFEPIV